MWRTNYMTEKQKLAIELTILWYIILSETANYFLMMTNKEEREWEQNFTKNNMKKYTTSQLETEVKNARAFCINQGFFND